MTRRVFAMSGFKGSPTAGGELAERAARVEVAAEAMRGMVLSHPKAAEMGVTPEALDHVHNYIHGLGMGQGPTPVRGHVGSAARVDSGDQIVITDSHVNGDGEHVHEGYRRNGPHFERVRIAERQVDGRTVIVNRRLGGH